MKIGATFVFGSLAFDAEKALPLWTHAFVTKLVDRFPPIDAGGLPPRFIVIEGGPKRTGDAA